MDLEIGKEHVDKNNSLPSIYKPSDLKEIPIKYITCQTKGKEYILREKALSALIKMFETASKDKIEMKVISAFRSFKYQKMLYEKACKENKNQKYTAMPGHSEHQLGTAVDITSLEIQNNITEKFINTKAYKWLKKNAIYFGFSESYSKENHKSKGYIFEPWHWRYLGKEIEKS